MFMRNGISILSKSILNLSQNISQILGHKNPRMTESNVLLDENLFSCTAVSSKIADASSIWPIGPGAGRRAGPLKLDGQIVWSCLDAWSS